MSTDSLIGFVYTTRVPDAKEFVESLVSRLALGKRKWVSSTDELSDDDPFLADTVAIVTVGGDGTILRTVRAAAPHGIPILGINLGRVGFMTEISVVDALQQVPLYLDGSPRIEERMMIQASVSDSSDEKSRYSIHALNDVVITRGSLARILDIDATVNRIPLTTYRADGVIVATSTGSTGYALSAGGPIISPDSNVLLLQPIAPHMSLHTGLVMDGNSVIGLKAYGDTEVILSVDGYLDTSLRPEDIVVVTKSAYVAKFMRMKPASVFYTNLFDRLGVKKYPAPLIST